MEVSVGVVTDIGITRKVNQDFYCIHSAETIIGRVVLAVVCDGMGGLSEGEYASQTMVGQLQRWFDTELPRIVQEGIESNALRVSLEKILETHNDYLIQYGEEKGIKVGTTISALLLVPGKYFYIHVGDSRIYQIKKREIQQITNDHSKVMQEVRMGLITPTQAERDTRKNQLTQCIGVRGSIRPDFSEGEVGKKCTFLLCSDGFVHQITSKEIWKNLRPNKVKNNEQLEEKISELVKLNKERMETDNITAVAVKMIP